MTKTFLSAVCLLSATLCLTSLAWASIDVYEFETAQQERQFRDLTKQLRCPKCQNQAISDSDAQIAQDMRAQVADMVRDGRSDQEVVGYFIERYGDFVTYKPPLKPETLLLWFLPVVALLWGLWLLIKLVRRAASLPTDDQQEPEQ